MNVRFVNCFVAVIGLICVSANGDVTAMPADPPISPQAQEALNMAPFADELAKIGPEVDKLMQNPGDQPTVSMVRNWLVDQDPTSATNPYQEAYATALNQAFMNALAQSNAPITARINVGIVISQLSGPKANLAPTITKLLGDANPAVALWGLKSAITMLPWALQDGNFNGSGQRDALLAAIVGAVSSHPDGPLSGPIAEAAYNAINPKMPSWRGAAPTGAAFSALIDANLKLQLARITIYQTTGVPAFPKGDTFPSFLLLTNPAWSTMTSTQQLQAAQQATNLVSLMGQRFSVSTAATMSQKQDLIEALQEEGKWINLLGTILSDQNIQAVGTVVNKVSAGVPAATLRLDCDAVFPALQQNQAFTQMTQPPPIGAPPGAPAAPAGPVTPKSASDNPPGGSSQTSEARP
jgi:hypothetical protein